MLPWSSSVTCNMGGSYGLAHDAELVQENDGTIMLTCTTMRNETGVGNGEAHKHGRTEDTNVWSLNGTKMVKLRSFAQPGY